MSQKDSISQSKIIELEGRLSQKSEAFFKEVEEVRSKATADREAAQKEINELHDRLMSLEEEKNQLIWNNQKENALQSEKLHYIEYQRDQARKELEEN